MDEAELFFGEYEALVIQEWHLTDATLEPSTFDVADEAHIELTGQRIYSAAVRRCNAAILLNHLAVDLGNQLDKSLDDFYITRDSDISYETAAIQKMRAVLEFVDCDAHTSTLHRDHSPNAEYRILIKNNVLNHLVSPSWVHGYLVQSADQGREFCHERSVRSSQSRVRQD